METTPTFWQRMTRATGTRPIAQTLSYYAAFIGLGLTTASLGPTLLGLADQTSSPLNEISFLFTARALGYLIGSFVGGRLYDRLPGHRTMAGALLIMGALLALVPELPLLWLLTAVLLLVGVMEGVVDVGGNTLIVWVHRKKVGPFMNGLHFVFGIGALLSPLVIDRVIAGTGSFQWAYWALAIVLVPIALRLLPLPNPPHINANRTEAAPHVSPVLLGLFVVFFMLFAGAEQSFGGWIFTYGIKTGLADETNARLLTAAYWGAFTLGRLISIPIAFRVRARVILFADLVGALAALALILIFSGSAIALWGGTLLLGLSVASGFPTMLIFAQRRITITGQVTGWFFVGASAGGMTIPWIIGQLIEPVGPWSAMAILLGVFALAFAAFLLLLAYTRRKRV